MINRLDLAYDILATMGYKDDDATRNLEGVLFNIDMVMNSFRKRRIEKETAVIGDRGTTSSVTAYPSVPVQPDPLFNGRLYFNLPGQVLDIRRNGGVSYIRYARGSGCADNLVGKPFSIVSPSEVHTIENITFQKPTPSSPRFWPIKVAGQDGDRVYMIGPNPMITAVEVGLYLAIDSSATSDPSQDIEFPADLVYHVKRIVLGMERFAILIPQERLGNEGRDFKVGQQPLQPPSISSVNEQINQIDTFI